MKIPPTWTRMTAPKTIEQEVLMAMGHMFYVDATGCTILVANPARCGGYGEVTEDDWAVAEAAAAAPVYTVPRRPPAYSSWLHYRLANNN